MDTCLDVIESLCCTPVTNTSLLINCMYYKFFLKILDFKEDLVVNLSEQESFLEDNGMPA